MLFANSLVNGLGGICFWFVAARLYAPSMVGVATAGTSIIVLLATISQFGLGMGIIRYASSLGPQHLRRLGSIFAITLVGALIAGFLFSRLVPSIAPALSPLVSGPLDIVLFVGSCVAWAVSVLFDSYLVSRRLTGLMVIDNSITAIFRIALIAIAPNPSIAQIVAFTGISGVVGVLAVIPALIRHPPDVAMPSEPPVTLRTLISYSLWNYWVAIMSTVTTLTMPSIVISFAGSVQTAAYYMAWSLFGGLAMLPSALSQVLLAVGAATPKPSTPTVQSERKSDPLMLLMVVLFVPIALATLALLGTTYITYGWLVVIFLAAGFWPSYRALLLQTEMRLVGSQQTLAYIYTVSYISTIGISIPLLVLIGAPGAALGWALGQYFLFLWLRQCVNTIKTKSTSPVG
jgi:O-antigen/teichoic acid export membrane protein